MTDLHEPYTLSPRRMAKVIENSQKMGELVCISSHDEVVSFDDTGQPTVYAYEGFPYSDGYRRQLGALSIGILRKNGLRKRQFVELPSDEIQLGDKLMMEDQFGREYPTGKIKTILPRQIDSQS